MMDIREVKPALGKRVRFRNSKTGCNGAYILTGCIIRRSERGAFFYQAELTDSQQGNAVCIAALGDVTREEDTA